MADDQTAALIAAGKLKAHETHDREAEYMLRDLADALERAQGIIDGAERENQTLAAHNVILMGRIDGVLAHRKWLLDMTDEAAKAGTEAGDYNAWVYRDIIEDLDRALFAQVKP